MVVFLFLLFTGNFSYSQTDSLINRFTKSSDVNERAAVAFEIGRLTMTSNPTLSVQYLTEAIRDSVQITDRLSLAKCIKVLAVTYFYKGLYDSSILFNDRAIRIFQQEKDSVQVNSTRKNRALSLGGKGAYAEAISVYLQALHFYKSVKDSAQIIGTLNDIGNAYLRLKDFQEGLKFQQEALYYLKFYQNLSLRGNVLNSVGYIYDVGKINRDSAIYYYKESLRIKEKHANVYSIMNTKSNLCSCYDLGTQLKETIQCFEDLLQLQKKVSDNTGIARSYVNLAVAFNSVNRYDRSLPYLQEAVRVASLTADPSLLASAYEKLALTYKLRNQMTQAYEAQEKLLLLRDSIYSMKQSELAAEMAAKYELEKKNRDVAETQARLSESENQRLRSELVIRNRNLLAIGLSLTLLFGTAVSLVVMQRMRFRKEKEKSEAVIAERNRGLQTIIDAQEEERSRIAKDLHDGVGNNLLALQMQAKQLRDEKPNSEQVDALLNNLSGIMDEVRTVSHQMMPRVLQEFGCVPAIRDMLEKSLGSGSIAFTFDTHHTDKRYHPRIETAVYRITQELINNIIKHSGATRVSVQLLESEQTLVLFVEDNGSGLAKSESDGLGMTSIKSRLGAINGELNIQTGDVGGTMASIRIPLT